jgi:hypothetical protein
MAGRPPWAGAPAFNQLAEVYNMLFNIVRRFYPILHMMALEGSLMYTANHEAAP